jgi:hypothetical protein
VFLPSILAIFLLLWVYKDPLLSQRPASTTMDTKTWLDYGLEIVDNQTLYRRFPGF